MTVLFMILKSMPPAEIPVTLPGLLLILRLGILTQQVIIIMQLYSQGYSQTAQDKL